MTKLTIDDNEYEIDDMSEDQKNILNVLNVGSNAEALLTHTLQCVSAVQNMKSKELKKLLKGNQDDKSE
tara:strand:- start:2732 stop:2938 length:207 start_codon:yes stop_codon:yes gene_type:complete